MSQKIFVDNYNPKLDKVICLSYTSSVEFKKIYNVDFLLANDLMGGNDYDLINEYFNNCINSWKFYNGKDFTKFEGISYGTVVQSALYNDFNLINLIWFGDVVKKIFDRFPDANELNSDVPSYEKNPKHSSNTELCNPIGIVVKHVTKTLGKKYCDLSNNTFPENPHFPLTEEFGLLCKKRIVSFRMKKRKLKSYMKLLFLSYTKKKKVPNVLLINYFNSNKLPIELSSNIFVSEYGTVNHKAGNYHMNLDYKTTTLNDISIRKISEIKKYFAKIKKRNYVFNGINYDFVFTSAIKHLFYTYIPDAIKYSSFLRNKLLKYKIKSVILNDTFLPSSILLQQLSRVLNIKTILVNHGMNSFKVMRFMDQNNAEYEISPRIINRCKQNFSKRKVIQLGSPILDNYDRLKYHKECYLWNTKKILFLDWQNSRFDRLSRLPFGEIYNVEMCNTIKYFLENGIEVHFRPRPLRKKYYKDFFEYQNIDFSNIKISPLTSLLYDILDKYDAVIGNISTAAFETLATGIPYIFLEPGYNKNNFEGIFAGINWKDFIMVQTSKDIIQIFQNEEEANERFSKFFKSFYIRNENKEFFRLDNKTSDRIKKFLQSNKLI